MCLCAWMSLVTMGVTTVLSGYSFLGGVDECSYVAGENGHAHCRYGYGCVAGIYMFVAQAA